MARRCLLRDTDRRRHTSTTTLRRLPALVNNLRALKSAPHVPQNSGYVQCGLLGPRRAATTKAMNEAEDHLPASSRFRRTFVPNCSRLPLGEPIISRYPPMNMVTKRKECHLHIDSRVKCQGVWRPARTCMSIERQKTEEWREL